MTYLMACLLGAFIGFGLASLRAPQRELVPNVVPLTPRERIAIGQVWRNAWPDYTDPDKAGA